MKYFVGSLLVLFIATANAQTCDITASSASGDWNQTGTWTPNTGSTRIPGTTDNVCWGANNTVYFPQSSGSTPSITADYSATIASMQIGNNDNLYIGESDSFKDYLGISGNLTEGSTSSNSATIVINSDGTLEIFGNVVINNHLDLVVNTGGKLIIHGNITVGANATMTVSGSVAVGGSFTTGNSANINVTGGSISVTGNVNPGNSSCLTLSGGGTFTTSGTCTPPGGSNCSSGSGGAFCSTVPITLNSFNVSANAQLVELNWSTSSEINFDHFVLERSSNGTQFSELTTVKGSGTSNTRKNYSYTDNNPFIGNSYYRLTSVDFDGYTEVFNNNVVRVTVNAGKNFYIAPNPIEGLNLKAGINFDASNTQVVIYDRMGVIVGRYSVSETAFELQLPNLTNGVYFAQLHSDGFTKSVRFVVSQ